MLKRVWRSEDEQAFRDDLAACSGLLRNGSRSFHAASLLLPAEIRDPATILYAFCRLADDAVDLSGGDLDATRMLRARLDALYAGTPQAIPADRALSRIVGEFGVPRELFDALIEGFEWDAEGRRYATIDELRGYAVRVAGTVGALMTTIMGVREPETLARAIEMGIAMQLSNIARDVGEDAAAGRLYLPTDWLREAGIDPDAWLANPVFSPALGGVIQRILLVAEELYRGSEGAIANLPSGAQRGIRVARQLYAAIGDQVARQRFDSVSSRAVVGTSRKLGLVALTLVASSPAKRASVAPVPETAFLVQAVVSAPPPRRSALRRAAAPAWWRIEDQAVSVIDLFERLERRERA